VAAPVAGITDLHNHIIDDTVEGHCDCMFFVNTHRWDFGLNAALLAPRPLLIVNTDSDSIFPLDGVQRVHTQVKQVYAWHRAQTNLGLVIAPGPHRDTQDLQVPVFRWFNRHLKGEDPLITDAAVKLFAPLELRVFESLPAEQRNTGAQEWFGPTAGRPDPLSDPEVTLRKLQERVFGGWPANAPDPETELTEDRRLKGLHWRTWSFESQPNVPLELHFLAPERWSHGPVVLHVLNAETLEDWSPDAAIERYEAQRRDRHDSAVAFFAPRGIESGAWSGEPREQIHIRRRFMLLGETVDGMRVWDIRRVTRVLRRVLPETERLEIAAAGDMAVNVLLASLYERDVAALRLTDLPESFRQGPDYLNILQILDIPHVRELARRRGIEVVASRAD
jgi:hypothetical protein